MSHASTPHRSYTGRVFVALEHLRAKLGANALQLWQQLLALRDHARIVHVTRAGLATMRGYAPLTDREVRRALDKLRAASLVEDIGWQFRNVRVGGAWDVREVYVRRVHGERHVDAATLPAVEGALVPVATRAWLAMATDHAHGGRRPGAGRPRRDDGRGEIKRSDPDEIKRSTDKTSEEREETSLIPPSGESVARGRALVRETFEGTERLAGGGEVIPWGAVLASVGRGIVPPFPSTSMLPPAIVPEPPRLAADLSPRVAATILLRAYQGAVDSRYGRRRHPPVAALVEKHLAALSRAADVLREHEIAPTMWAAWSLDVWRDYIARGRNEDPPAVAWVFGAKRVEDAKARAWFGKEGEGYSGGRVVMGPEHRALIERWYRMEAAIRRARAVTPDALREVVARYFPGDAFDRAAQRVRAEASQQARELVDRVTRGEFVW